MSGIETTPSQELELRMARTVGIVDEFLANCIGRELIGTDEVTNTLLDARLALTTATPEVQQS